jgi:hypothetical protein
VRDWIASPDDQGWTYTVEVADGQEMEVAEESLTATGEYEGPFRQYEVVEVHPLDFETEPSVTEIVGQRAVVTSLGLNPQTKEWDIFVVVQSGESWVFDEEELQRTGIICTPDNLYAPAAARPIRVRVDPVTHEGTLVAGTLPENWDSPVPLQVDLNSL